LGGLRFEVQGKEFARPHLQNNQSKMDGRSACFTSAKHRERERERERERDRERGRAREREREERERIPFLPLEGGMKIE
jgi:hypothetical protein